MLHREVLDHGFARILNVAGPNGPADDTDPAQVARISFDNLDADRTRDQDIKLCDYLLRNMHTSPFEHIQIWLEMKMPIFVARQFVRHRTQGINEVSGRYVTLPEEWYIPEVVGGKAKSNKQGQVDNLRQDVQDTFKAALNAQCDISYRAYLHFMHLGVAPEHARMYLHLNHYTHWVTTINLHNLMHFLSLRADSHAQVEAVKYAEAIISMMRTVLPEMMKLFDKHRRGSRNIEALLIESLGEKTVRELGLDGAAQLLLRQYIAMQPS